MTIRKYSGDVMEESVSTIQVIVHQPSPPSIPSEIQMQLLSVPGDAEHEICITGDEKEGKPRRYSTNTPGSHGHKSHMMTSPNVRRRSSLAAIKWSSIARRFSMGMSHDREPPEDPAKVILSHGSLEYLSLFMSAFGINI